MRALPWNWYIFFRLCQFQNHNTQNSAHIYTKNTSGDMVFIILYLKLLYNLKHVKMHVSIIICQVLQLIR